MDVAQAASGGHAASLLILLWIGKSLLFGTLLAGLTYLLTRLPRFRIGPTIEASLWLIVLIKFLAPVGPIWSFSLPTAHLRLLSDVSPHSAMPVSPIALDASRLSAPVVDVNSPQPRAAAAPTISAGQSLAESGSSRWRWTTPVSTAYLLCVLGLFVLRVRGRHRLVVQCQSLPAAEGATLDLVTAVCRRLGVRRIPRVRISDEYPAPFLMGFVRPLLVLSRDLLVRPDELETVIVHEVAHLRRGDTFVRYLQWVAGTLLFFWPVVAWVNRRLDVVREYACDEWALRQGKLTAGEYARCLLRAAQSGRPPRWAHHPCRMAANPKTIERRIDMILKSPHRSANRRRGRLLPLALLLVWAGVTLTGAVAGPHVVSDRESAIHQRAADLYALVLEHEAADFNHDTVLSYLEKDTYLVALAMRNAAAFMDEFPYADRNHSGNLDILEARDVIRAVTLIAYADRRASAATENELPLDFCEAALDAQTWLLTNLTAEPEPSELDNIWSVLRRVQNPPGGYTARMLDHGGPAPSGRKGEARFAPSLFQELEGNVTAVETRLAEADDPADIARLQLMLTKLEDILSKLQD